MGFWSSIGSAISSAFSACCSAVGSIVKGLSSFAPTFGPTIMGAFSKINPIISAIVTAFNIFKPNEKIEEMGDRAIQAGEAGIQMEEYDDYNDYLEAIRNFPLNPDKSKSIDPDQKKLAGMGVACKGIEEKFNLPDGTGGMIAVLAGLDSDYFNSDRLENYLRSGNIKSIIDYFDGKLQPDVAEKTVDKIIEIEKMAGNDKDEDTIFDDIQVVKNNLDKD